MSEPVLASKITFNNVIQVLKIAIKDANIRSAEENTGKEHVNVQSDKEFLTVGITFFKENCTKVYYRESDHKTNIVERLVRTIKHQIVLRMEAIRSERWI